MRVEERARAEAIARALAARGEPPERIARALNAQVPQADPWTEADVALLLNESRAGGPDQGPPNPPAAPPVGPSVGPSVGPPKGQPETSPGAAALALARSTTAGEDQKAGVVRFSRPWEPPSQHDALRERIVRLLLDEHSPDERHQQRRADFRSQYRWARPPRPPRAWAWAELWHRVGGRHRGFPEVVADLIREGRIVEVWDLIPGRRDPGALRHSLVPPERWEDYFWGEIIDVRGRQEILERLGLA